MRIVYRLLLIMTVACAFALAACSDDDNPTNGGSTDTSPPGVSSVTPVDAYHVNVTFTEPVTKASAENTGNYSIIVAPVPAPGRETAAAGGALSIAAAALGSGNTVTLTTGSSMAGLNLSLVVTNVSDTHGNRIQTPVQTAFIGSSDPDTTPPQIVSRSPAPGATNVAVGTTVVVQFNEPINYGTFTGGFSWSSTGGSVPIDDIQYDGTTFTVYPATVLTKATSYTIALSGVQDIAGNTMAVMQWSFTTTNITDTTPPTLVSTIPANNATNVNVNTNLVLTFSEPIEQNSIEVSVYPDPGNGTATWSNGGKTVTFDPDLPLLDNQQYVLALLPGAVRDLAGNRSEGVVSRVFSTGSTLESGSIAGTIMGDPGTAADDPTGAFVVAGDGTPFQGDFNFLGSAIVAGNDTYNIQHLYDGTYFLISALDTDHDGNLEPEDGDAFGLYGIDFRMGDLEADSVVIAGGNHATNINFPLYDSSAIQGLISYDGIYAGDFYPILVGLFEVSGFDPTDIPIAGDFAYWPYEPYYSINSFDQSIPDGSYYVGAFMDLNGNDTYDAASEPAGFYGGLPAPTAVNIANGSDEDGVDILLADPFTAASTAVSVQWPAPKHNAKFQRICELIRQGQQQATR